MRLTIAIGLSALVLQAGAAEATLAALDLPYQKFDQTPHSGWRLLAQDQKRFREAAALIDDYLTRHSDLNRFERSTLHWHALQCLAMGGETAAALKHLASSRLDPEPPDSPIRWNDYVDATGAFLNHNRAKLLAARRRMATSKPDDANLHIVDSFIAHFNEPYSKAYGEAK